LDGPSSTWLLASCTPVFFVHVAAIALNKALQTYSRSRLEELTEARGRPERADQIAHLDARTERAAEAVAVAAGLFLAVAAGLILDRQETLAASTRNRSSTAPGPRRPSCGSPACR